MHKGVAVWISKNHEERLLQEPIKEPEEVIRKENITDRIEIIFIKVKNKYQNTSVYLLCHL